MINGVVQTLNKDNKIKNINFEKTELSITNFDARTIVQPKIQEISSYKLLACVKDNFSKNCAFKDNKKIVIETLSRRIGMPLYIPLISVIASFLLFQKKERKYNFLKKYIIFFIAFIILVAAEILLRFTGFSLTNFMLYFFSPLVLLVILYSILLKKMISERITR